MRAALLAMAVLLACAMPAVAAAREAPRGWLGVTVDGPMTDSGIVESEWDLMATSGVETVRVAMQWRMIEPLPQAFDFTHSDAIVAAAAARGMAVLPVLQGTPAWASAQHTLNAPPRRAGDYARFVGEMARRYGSRGSFWAERPDLRRQPIRAWQLWNEPNLDRYWSEQPFARRYVRLLRAARRALRRVDPGAQAILAGLPNFSWRALRSIYRAGGRGAFDAVALHPYTSEPRNVLRVLRLARHETRRAGDGRRPIWVTELSWPAALGVLDGQEGFYVTEEGQAQRIRAGVRLLLRERRRLRIEKVLWYTWLSDDENGAARNAFAYSGLRRVRAGAIVSALSLDAFTLMARELQGCAKAPANARACA